MAPPHQQTFGPAQQPAPEQQAPAPEQQAPTSFLPQDLMIETFSFLPVRSLLRYKCVSTNINMLTVDPSFIKLHLGRSPTNRNMVAIRSNDRQVRVISCSERVQGPPFNMIPKNEFQFSVNTKFEPLTTCNGLLSFVEVVDGSRKTKKQFTISGAYRFCFWNPALKKKFKESPLLTYKNFLEPSVKGFGWDCVNNIYKIAVVLGPSDERHVNVYNLGGKKWRDIGAFPAVPIHKTSVYVSGNLSCLAVLSVDSISKNPFNRDELLIISFDLSSETFRRMSLPSLADIAGYTRTHLGVLLDKLSFSHYCKMSTHFIIWTMEDFGIEDSWRMLARITVENLPMPIEDHTMWQGVPPFTLRPWNLSPNREFLTLKMPGIRNSVIGYNCKEHEVVGSRQFQAIEWMDDNNYLESLVSPV